MGAYLEDGGLNYAPVVEAVLHNPLRTRLVRLKLLIDTGFQGSVLIPLSEYLKLGLNLFEEGEAVAVAAAGAEVRLRVARGILEIEGVGMECRVYTTLGVRRALLGREVLKRLGMLYKPPDTLRIPL
ncbi:MAG: hypothetical protein DRJ96_07435 [Thermoprotei archaeon]|nr:hypothetical protein [Thermoproteales archaeon]RLE86852.1 MAG: hypothetical protein DRJ67_06225 [Thermoprotei archaeon]RLE96097.1 MAG: hypothetical protein DRJ96_07435 [Thermoprotei archaeon]